MLFSSLTFLQIFLPIVIIGNLLLTLLPIKNNIKAKNIFLLVMSIIFYAWGGFYYLGILISSITVNYFAGFFITKFDNDLKKKKIIFIVTIIVNIGILFFFKYFNMVIAFIESLMRMKYGLRKFFTLLLSNTGTGELNIMKIVLPIGISFYTFQSMSYVIDVYTKKCEYQKDFLNFALYVSFFPQLIAGPIVKYNEINEQINDRNEDYELFFFGFIRFVKGLSKKVLIANVVAQCADKIFALEIDKLGFSLSWLGIICYTLQIYFDFSGYSDMAIGLGNMFGFKFKENFDHPYMSLSIQEFWRRWHISLSSWFKEYVYIPLGGNRKGNKRTYLNLFIVFLLTGIWHGANLTFIVWGIYFGIFLIIERLFLGNVLKNNKYKFINWIYTILVVVVGWVFFRSDNILLAFTYLKQMFTFTKGNYSSLTYLTSSVFMCIIVGILLSGYLQNKTVNLRVSLNNKLSKFKYHDEIILITKTVVTVILLFLCIASLISDTYNPFIYFQF